MKRAKLLEGNIKMIIREIKINVKNLVLKFSLVELVATVFFIIKFIFNDMLNILRKVRRFYSKFAHR